MLSYSKGTKFMDVSMNRKECLHFLEESAEDLCICGVASEQIDLEKLSDDELNLLVSIIKKVRLNESS